MGAGGPEVLPPGAVKRIALAAAIQQQPACLLLEWPDVALDAQGIAGLAALLPEVAAQGTAIGLLTHAPALRALAAEPAR